MAAPKKNEYWRLRTKHGRDRIFETPEDLLISFLDYVNLVEETNEEEKESIPFTIVDFCKYIKVNSHYLEDHQYLPILKDICFSKNLELYNQSKIPHQYLSKELNRRNLLIDSRPGYTDGDILRSKDSKPVKNEQEGTVYFIRAVGTKFYKIGFSKNHQRRLQDLNASSPFKIEIIAITHNNIYAFDIEQELHKMHAKNYVKNEWYKLGHKEVLNIKSIINNYNK